jgi:hypothetical protein
MTDWQSYIKKYVWDDDKTPYFTPVRKLNKYQADHEVFFYAFMIVILFFFVSIISLTENAPHGKSYGVALYTFSVACSAVRLGTTKHVYAAFYLALAPLVTLVYFLVRGFPPNLATIDEVVLVVVCLALLWYSKRVVAIAHAYPHLPDAPEER